jgi:hypothetical protein
VLLLSGKLKEITDSYFEREAWHENEAKQQRPREEEERHEA